MIVYVQEATRVAAAGGCLLPMTVAAADAFPGSGSLRIFFCKPKYQQHVSTILLTCKTAGWILIVDYVNSIYL